MQIDDDIVEDKDVIKDHIVRFYVSFWRGLQSQSGLLDYWQHHSETGFWLGKWISHIYSFQQRNPRSCFCSK